MPHFNIDWNAVLTIVVALATAILRQAIKTPTSAARAQKIKILADDAAAMAIDSYPNADWAKQLQAVIERLGASLPDIDGSVLESAATGALTRLGAKRAPVASISDTAPVPSMVTTTAASGSQ